MIKKLLVYGFLACVLLVVGIFGFLYIKGNDLVKGVINDQGPKLTGVDVRLASVSLSPFSGSGSLGGLHVGNPEGFKTPYAFELDNIDVAIQLSSLTSDTIVIDKVHVIGPRITYEKSLSSSNLDRLLAQIKERTGGDKPAAGAAPGESGAPSKKIIIKDFLISKAQVNLSVTALGGNAVPVVLPDIHLTNLGSESTGGLTPDKILEAILSETNGTVIKETAGQIGDSLKKAGSDIKEAGKGVIDDVKGLFGK